ncbi:MAG: HAD family hydrolase [Coriobacteriia bacterium]
MNDRGLNLDVVFFDVGNTLLRPHPSVAEVCREILADDGYAIGIDAIEPLMPLVDAYYEERYREDDNFWASTEAASEVWVGMYSLLCRELGIAEDSEKIALRVYDAFGDAKRWAPYDDVWPAFERLRGRGLRIGLISNWDDRLASIVEGLGMGEFVETTVCSAAVGLSKPDPRIFELACERMGVSPQRCAHVGDHQYADVMGARLVGMQPVLIDRNLRASMPAEQMVATLDDLDQALGL